MPFKPRSAREILRSMVARVQARSKLTDAVEGSVALMLLAPVAEEINGVELRLARIRDSFFFDNTEGADLDERVAELPNGMKPRLPAVAASGEVMSVTRADATAGVQVLPAGSTFGRTDDSKMLYRTTTAVTFGAGVETVTRVRIVCLTPGTAGNAAGAAINRIISAPSWVRGAVSNAPLSNGMPQETDAQLRRRAKLYLASLARCQPRAIEYAGLSFEASDKSRFKFVRLFEDVARPGYSELVVDDGSGLQGMIRDGRPVTGAVPDGGIGLLWHEGPAAAPIQQIKINGQVVRAQVGQRTRWVSVPERGLVIILDPLILVAGDTWEISNYRVYTGAAAELQDVLEGTNDDPSAIGFRACTTRVRVVPPLAQDTALDLHIVPVNGVDLEALENEVLDDIVEFVATLGPGEPLLIAALIDFLMNNPNLRNVRIYAGGSEPPKLAFDVYPTTARHVLRTSRSLLNVIPAPEN